MASMNGLKNKYGAKGSYNWVPRPISNIKPKGPDRGGKRPRTTKEGLKLLGEIAEDRHVLGELVS